jgi:hypothetical protein
MVVSGVVVAGGATTGGVTGATTGGVTIALGGVPPALSELATAATIASFTGL